MNQRTIEQQITAKCCPICGKNVRPLQATLAGRARRTTNLDYCRKCWCKTREYRDWVNQQRQEARAAIRTADCRSCVHWDNGRCSLEFPDRDPDCVAFVRA